MSVLERPRLSSNPVDISNTVFLFPCSWRLTPGPVHAKQALLLGCAPSPVIAFVNSGSVFDKMRFLFIVAHLSLILRMPGIASFKLLGSRYFYISINIPELCCGAVIWNSSIFSNLALAGGATAMLVCGFISHHGDQALLGPLTDALWAVDIFHSGWWEPEPFPALCDSLWGLLHVSPFRWSRYGHMPVGTSLFLEVSLCPAFSVLVFTLAWEF